MMRDEGWIHRIGKIVKRNYPWTDIDNVVIRCYGCYEDLEYDYLFELSEDLTEKLDSHTLFYADYRNIETEFIDVENEDRLCFTDGKRERHEPHDTILLDYNEKYDNEIVLYHLFKEHKINDPNIVEEIVLRNLKTPKIDLKPLKNCSNLTCLDIYFNENLIDIDNIELIPTRNIRTLSFRSSRPFYSYIKLIQEMKELVKLSLSIKSESPLIDLTPIITTNQKIEDLHISTNNYKKINIEQLYLLKNLWNVEFRNIHDVDFHSLYKLEKLEFLEIYSNEEIDYNKLLPLLNKDVKIRLCINGKEQFYRNESLV